MVLSIDTDNNNLSLLVVKTFTFSGRTSMGHRCPQRITSQPVLKLPAAALSLSAGPVSGAVVPVGHLHTTGWENRVQVEKNPNVSL